MLKPLHLISFFLIFLSNARRELRDSLDISISIYSSTLDGLRFTYQDRHSFAGQAWSGKVYWVVTEDPLELTCQEIRAYTGALDEHCFGYNNKTDAKVYHVTLKCGFIPMDRYYLFIATDSDGKGGHCVNYIPHGKEMILGATSPPSRSEEPSQTPSIKPSHEPTPTQPSRTPSSFPTTSLPSHFPLSSGPSKPPSPSSPSQFPTAIPSILPTACEPTLSPSIAPTPNVPSKAPSRIPSQFPSLQPTQHPLTSPPTPMPFEALSTSPTLSYPSHSPSRNPSIHPTWQIYQEDLTFPLDYKEVIGNRAVLFLDECTKLCISECILVRSGSIVLTLEGRIQDVKADIENITRDCLHVEPDFPQMCMLSGTMRNEYKEYGAFSGHNPWIWMLIGTFCICLACLIYPLYSAYGKVKKRTMKDDITQEALIEDVRREALKHRDEIVLRSESVDDCLARMNDFVETYADAWVKRDPVLKEKPDLEPLKEELSQVFRVACKLSEMLIAAREHALLRLDVIVDKAKSESDCVGLMKVEVDDFCSRFRNQDDFFKKVPISQVEAAKTALIQSFGMHLPTSSIYAT